MRVAPARGWRPWREAQAEFWADGTSPFEVFPRRLAMPLAEWGLNWCICNYAHQFLMFHSAVVEKTGRAAILAGPPGSGKSTLCAALMARGWRLLSDEFALLDPARGWLLPIPRPVALKSASIGLVEKLLPHLPDRSHLRPDTTRARSRISARRPMRSSVRPNQRCRVGSCFRHMPKTPTRRLVPLRKAAGFVRLARELLQLRRRSAAPRSMRWAS